MSCCGGDEEVPLVKKQPTRQTMDYNSAEPEEDMTDPFAMYQCRRCRKIYKAAENNPKACCYHPGKYAKGNTAVFSSTEWSCCKTLAKNAKGCREDRHRPSK